MDCDVNVLVLHDSSLLWLCVPPREWSDEIPPKRKNETEHKHSHFLLLLRAWTLNVMVRRGMNVMEHGNITCFNVFSPSLSQLKLLPRAELFPTFFPVLFHVYSLTFSTGKAYVGNSFIRGFVKEKINKSPRPKVYKYMSNINASMLQTWVWCFMFHFSFLAPNPFAKKLKEIQWTSRHSPHSKAHLQLEKNSIGVIARECFCVASSRRVILFCYSLNLLHFSQRLEFSGACLLEERKKNLVRHNQPIFLVLC